MSRNPATNPLIPKLKKPAGTSSSSRRASPKAGRDARPAVLDLGDSEIRYRRLFESARDGIFILEAGSGLVIDVNPFLVKMLGFTKAQICGKQLWELGFFNDIAENKANFKELQQKKFIRYDDLPLKTADGRKFRVEFVSNVYQEGDTQVIQCNVRDITERIQADADLQESEKRFQDLARVSPVGIFRTDQNGTTTYVNPRWCQISGLSVAEALGDGWLSAVHPQDKEKLVKSWQASTRLHQSSYSDYRFVHPDGTIAWVMGQAVPELNSENQIVGYVGTITDITERKRIEAERKALLEIMQGVTASGSLDDLLERIRRSLAKVISADNFFVVFHNKSTGMFEEVFAVDQYDAPMPPSRLEKSITSYVFRSGEALLLDQARFEELAAHGEVELVGTNSASWLGAPLKTPTATIGVMVVQNYAESGCYSERDKEFLSSVSAQVALVIERKRTEQALLESEKRFRALVENSLEEISLVDSHGTLTWESPTSRRPLGYPPNAFVGHSLLDLIHPDERLAAARLLEQIQSEPGSLQAALFRLRHQDGSWRWMEGVLTNLLDEPAVQSVVINYRDVTQRKQAEEALRASEEEFHSLAEAMPQMVWITRPDGWNIYFNSQWVDYTGLTLEESYGDGWIKPFHPDDQPRAWEAWQNATHNNGTYSIECRLRRADGVYKWWLVRAVPILDSQGVILKWFGTCTDINEIKKSEQALLESENQYRTLVDEVNDGFFITNELGVFTLANPALARIYGFESPQELLGRKFMDFIVPERVAALSDVTRNTMHSGIPPEVINGQILRPDGSQAFVEIKAVPVLENGKMAGSRGVVRDVTERKQAEKKLEDERILLRTLIDNLPDQIYVMDVQGRKIIANQADWQASGKKTMEEVIGKTDLEIYPPELANNYWALDRSVIDSGTPMLNREEPGFNPGGRPVWLLSSKVPLRDGQGKVIGLVGIGRDITELKHSEAQIRSHNAELTALYQLSRLLADAGDLAAVLALVNRHAVENVHTTFAGIALLEEGVLVLRAVYPVRSHSLELTSPGTRQLLSDLPVSQRLLETNEPSVLEADNTEIGSLERGMLLLDFARSVCLVPLRVGDASQGASQALGLLILGEARQKEREPFTQDKLHMARSIGDQAASAIWRQLLKEQAGRRSQQLAALSEIDRTIASIMDLRISLQMILRHVCEQLEVDAADVMVFNEVLQTLEYIAGRGFRSAFLAGVQQRIGEGQAGKAALERQMVRIPDLSARGVVFAHPAMIKSEQVAAYFAVPLINKGKLKGVLEVYLRTPFTPNEEWLEFLSTLAGQAAIAVDNVQMFDRLQRSTDELELAYDATIEGWSHALDLRDKETEGHTQRVTGLTVELARQFGLNEADLAQIRWGALLHDIGKMGVPDGILLKPGPLTDEEWVLMRKHPIFAYEMLASIRYLRQALDIPYCHHEKWDGTGYPRALKGDLIPLAARIFAVVDVWDALTSDRPYRLAWSKEKTLQHIRDGAGTHFDPRVVERFLQSLGDNNPIYDRV